MTLEVMHPGLLTTVQDLGRTAYQASGVIRSGAMDEVALRLANLLVGNPQEEAGLELTLVGPTLRFVTDGVIAIGGADLSPKINGVPIHNGRPYWVRGGSLIQFGQSKSGCRAYLAVAGGLDLPVVLGSRSTYLRAGIGGFSGRALQRGDVLPTRRVEEGTLCHRLVTYLGHSVNQNGEARDEPVLKTPSWFVNPQSVFAYQDLYTHEKIPTRIRVVTGSEYMYFTKESQKNFFQNPYQVTPQSDRMGYRLNGAALQLQQPLSLLSEGVAHGTIQVPAEGQPIVLLTDRQTIGGYPKIAGVITTDLPQMAQRKPGDWLKFQEVSLVEAQELYLRREQEIAELAYVLDFTLRQL